MNQIFDKNFRFIFLILVLVELLSFSGYLWPCLNSIAFFIITVSVLILSLKRLEFGLLAVLAELFISSKGYLFFLDLGGTTISIRIALWLIVLSVWFGKLIGVWIKDRKIPALLFFGSKYFYYFLILFAFIGWGLINGVIHHNTFSNIFFDFNNWLYLALIFPIYDIFLSNGDETIKRLIRIFTASTLWVSLKTFILLFIFSHNMIGLVYEVYRWVRDSGVGEITLIQGGFYRIFFQSHIFVLALFMVFIYWLTDIDYKEWNKKKREIMILISLSSGLFAVNLITFSRSNWIGLIAGLFCIFLLFVRGREWRKIGNLALNTAIVSVAALLLIIVAVKFPYPNPIGGFDTASLLTKRASQLTGEAGVSSRWSLLPELREAIAVNPITGSGYGTTVTYISQDPRVLENNPSGEYTTYAFEWGWLDIWLKLGIFGLLSYLLLAVMIIIDCFMPYGHTSDMNNIYLIGLSTGYIGLLAISLFSPYMNHPLGLGYLIILAVFCEKIRQKNPLARISLLRYTANYVKIIFSGRNIFSR